MDSDRLQKAINGAYKFCEEQQTSLDKGEISEEQWFDIHKNYFTDIYLRTNNPRLQSGHSGNDERYRYTQGMLLEALFKNGSFIDIGCANGYLIEKLNQWTNNIGIQIEYFGLDISSRLLEVASQRLPKWKSNLYLGNALYWEPPFQFDYVCIRELDYVPKKREKALFQHLYNDLLSINGRLLLGPLTALKEEPGLIELIKEWGFNPSGYCFKSHQDYKELIRRLYWFEKKCV